MKLYNYSNQQEGEDQKIGIFTYVILFEHM